MSSVSGVGVVSREVGEGRSRDQYRYRLRHYLGLVVFGSIYSNPPTPTLFDTSVVMYGQIHCLTLREFFLFFGWFHIKR